MFPRWPLGSSEAFSFAVLTTLAVLASPSSATDIEGLFEKQNDLSGTYTVSTGLMPDSSTYGGTLTILKPKQVTTPRGTKINFYMLRWDGAAKVPIPGLAVQAGDRLYFAYGTHDKYGLIFWCKWDMPSDVRNAIVQKGLMQGKVKKGELVTFKGKSEPYWWRMDDKTNGFGYYFHVNGNWGATTMRSCEFPIGTNVCDASVRQLKPNGERDPKAYNEYFRLAVDDHGENVIIRYVHEKDSYDGTGMRVADELVFGSWGTSSDGGVGYYEFKGKQLVGTQAMTDSKERGIEILEAPEDVVARNPDLFK